MALGGDILAVLEMHREQQALLRADYGEDWAGLDLIFCKPNDYYMSPGTVSRACIRIGKRAGLKESGLHILRHSHGSQLLASGLPLPAVSKRLGHSDVYTTARVYAHAMPGDEASAGEVWEEKMRKGGKG